MTQKVGYVAVVVLDYDEALTYFINVLGFELIEDTLLDARMAGIGFRQISSFNSAGRHSDQDFSLGRGFRE